ncbi:MAG: TlpA family protein disulfide reductase [Gammaproteobacteria bacterium]|nr:TlpA family protein disulfide reductase [Gammaproteobacteria bacterium]
MRTRKFVSVFFILSMLIFFEGCTPDALDIYGRPIRISDYRGKWIVINYWATWCVPCIQEIPELNKLAKYYKHKVIVLGVNVDNLSDSVLRNLSQGYQVNYPFLSSFPIEKWGGKPDDLPVTYIIDPHGKLSHTLHGPQKLENFQAVMSLPAVTYD